MIVKLLVSILGLIIAACSITTTLLVAGVIIFLLKRFT